MQRFFLVFALIVWSIPAHAQTPATWRTTLDSVSIRLFLRDTAFAEVMMNRVVAAVPDSAEAWYSRAVFYGQLRRWDNVAQDCQKALALREELTYYFLLSEAQLALKQPQAAIKTLSAASGFAPEHELPFYYRGLVAMRLGDVENAILDFSDALALDAHFSEAYLKRGMAQVSAKHPTEAIRDFDSCLVLEPGRAEAYFLRGSVKLDQGNKKDAAADLIKAAELGYRTATDLLRGYCADIVPKSRIDSLQNYQLQEVTVEAEHDVVALAKQEMKTISRRVSNIISSMIGRTSTLGYRRESLTLGVAGSGILVGSVNNNAPVSLTLLESKPSSHVSLQELVDFYRNRVMLLNNEKAKKIMRDIQNLQQNVAMNSANNTRDNAALVREQLHIINARFQELQKAIEQAETEKDKTEQNITASKK